MAPYKEFNNGNSPVDPRNTKSRRASACPKTKWRGAIANYRATLPTSGATTADAIEEIMGVGKQLIPQDTPRSSESPELPVGHDSPDVPPHF